MVHNDNNASYVRGSFEAYIYGFSFDECETTKLIFNELFSVVPSTHTQTHSNANTNDYIANWHNNTDNIVKM